LETENIRHDSEEKTVGKRTRARASVKADFEFVAPKEKKWWRYCVYIYVEDGLRQVLEGTFY
jgi:hypothetical protein